MAFEPRISIITLGVSDLKKSNIFYQKLGWSLSDQSNDSVSFFQGRGIVLGLYGEEALADDAQVPFESDENINKFRGNAIAYNCNNELEVDKLFAHAINIGGKSVKHPEKVFWGGYSGYFADPDNHLWEVAYNPFFAMSEDGHLDLNRKVR